MTVNNPGSPASSPTRIGFRLNDSALWRRNVLSRRAQRKKTYWPVFLFLTALLVPWAIFIGELRLSIYRFVLLVMTLPCLVMWMAGKAGRIRTVDIMLLLFSFWCTLSLIVIHGMDLVTQTAGIGFVETVGSYMLARCYIRDADDFYNVTRLLFRIVLFLLPFAIVELVTGYNIWRALFAAIWPVKIEAQMPGRSGLTRVQMGFDHPILFGMFVASILAPVHLVLGYQKDFLQRCFKTGIVGLTSFMSLSAGPVTSLVVQGLLLSWNGLSRAIKFRWQILIGLLAVMYLAIDLVAKRSPLTILVNFLLFDEGSYWYRLYIWDYGTASVMNHPIFGIGLKPWEHPGWMSNSIDNFWLLFAVRYGLPAPFLLLLTMLSIVVGLAFKKGLDNKVTEYRTALIIALMGFFVIGWTVDLWDTVYVNLLFLMGSGVWMLDVRSKERVALEAQMLKPGRLQRQTGPRVPSQSQ
jgi:O-Antigen ligase